MRRRQCLSLLLRSGLALPFIVHAKPLPADQAWPSRSILFVVPLAPGGGLDFIARLIARYVALRIGQDIIVENRTGAGGIVGIESALASPPDGYTVLMTNDNIASAPHVRRSNVDYLAHSSPVVLLARQPQCLAVHSTLGVNTIADLIQLAKDHPGLGCATSGIGSNQHVLLEWLNKRAGIKLEHIPYRGAGEAIVDLVAGQVKIAILAPTALLPYVKNGMLQLLAQSSATRAGTLSSVPTFQEAGFEGMVLDAWIAAFCPKDTPDDITSRLNAEINKALTDASIRDSLRKTATEVAGGSPGSLGKFAEDESKKYAQLISELNIKID